MRFQGFRGGPCPPPEKEGQENKDVVRREDSTNQRGLMGCRGGTAAPMLCTMYLPETLQS